MADHFSPNQEKIIAAAQECFMRYGSQRTTMEDIATEAGLSRKTLYREFADRTALMAALLDHRTYPLIDALRERLDRSNGLEEAIVEGIVHVIAKVRDDPLYMDILNRVTDGNADDPLLQGSAKIQQLVQETWRPPFVAARASGELQSGLSDDRLIEGVRAIATLLNLRTDLGPDDQRRFLRDFFIPSIVGRS